MHAICIAETVASTVDIQLEIIRADGTEEKVK